MVDYEPCSICEEYIEGVICDKNQCPVGRMKAEIFKLKEEVKHFQLKNSELFKMNNSIVEENDYIKSEIERLSKQPKTDLDEIIKSKAIKEFAERLKILVIKQFNTSTMEKQEAYDFCLYEIDNLVKELTDNTEPIKSKQKPKQGKWLINPDGYYPYCSECEYEPKAMTKFCPECGADMRSTKRRKAETDGSMQ